MEVAVGTDYETDVVAWASEQARLIRAGRFDLLDREHIAEEIEDVGKSEQRELATRMAVSCSLIFSSGSTSLSAGAPVGK